MTQITFDEDLLVRHFNGDQDIDCKDIIILMIEELFRIKRRGLELEDKLPYTFDEYKQEMEKIREFLATIDKL